MSTLTLRSDHEKLVDAVEDFRLGGEVGVGGRREGGRGGQNCFSCHSITQTHARVMTRLRLESGANRGDKQLPCNRQPKSHRMLLTS